MVLQGKRLPSPDMLQRLSRYLAHNESEHRYLEILVEREKRLNLGAATPEFERELWKINPKAETTHPLSLEAVSLMGEWFFFVIKQLVDTAGFREDYKWIRQRLRGKISVAEIRAALRVLGELGLVERQPDGRLRTTKRSVRTTRDISSAALREHHRQLAQRGIEALAEQAPADREFATCTLRVSPEALPKVKEAIRDFMIQFDKKFENLDSERVYQVNVQFFEHTVDRVKKKEAP